MKKKLFLFLITLSAIAFNLQAQDLIVTNDGDSINCKITKQTKDYVYFTFMYDNEIRNSLLSVNQITTHQKKYFSQSELPADYIYEEMYPRFRFAVDAGWQYRTAKTEGSLSSQWKEHINKMKSGFHYDVQAAYFFTETMGVEPMFSQQLFSHSLGNGTLSDEHGNVLGSGYANEKITFSYIGANYIMRYFDSKKKNCWIFSLGLGYLGYKDVFLFDNVAYKTITASTLATVASIGYDIGLSKELALGFKVSATSGMFRDYKETINGSTTNKKLPDNTAEGLGTIRLSVGLRFNK